MVAPNFDELLKQLNEIVPGLTATRLMLLNCMALALKVRFDSFLSPSSDLATLVFSEYFASRLLIHHAVVEEKLNKKSFEYILRDSFRHDGRNAFITTSAVYPGTDLIVDGVRFSLKTEASRDIQNTRITISKFMEARWIRDQDAYGLAQLASNRLAGHLAGYDRILMLRAFNVVDSKVKYDLIEIPHNLLNIASHIQPADINLNPGLSGGGSATIWHNNHKAFTLRFDGSVEKVTITNLSTELCINHATWIIPLTISELESGI